MSNIFQEVLADAGAVEERLLGPNYEYWKQIKTPPELGMTSDGTLGALGKDIDGLVQYVEVLVTGQGASKTGRPLGNKFFLPTGVIIFLFSRHWLFSIAEGLKDFPVLKN